jgi:hypothetical protein
LRDERDGARLYQARVKKAVARIEQVALDKLSLVRPQSTDIFVIERP